MTSNAREHQMAAGMVCLRSACHTLQNTQIEHVRCRVSICSVDQSLGGIYLCSQSESHAIEHQKAHGGSLCFPDTSDQAAGPGQRVFARAEHRTLVALDKCLHINRVNQVSLTHKTCIDGPNKNGRLTGSASFASLHSRQDERVRQRNSRPSFRKCCFYDSRRCED